MKAKDLVGKLVTSNYLESRRTFPPWRNVQGSRICPEYEFGNSRRRTLGLARFGYVRPCNREVQNLLVSPTM